MKRTLKTKLDQAKSKSERNKKILKLRSKRNDLDEQIDNLSIENEVDSLTSTIESAENILIPFINNMSAKDLNVETPLNFILDENEKAEVFEKIFDHYGIKIPEDEEIETFGDLVNIMDRLK